MNPWALILVLLAIAFFVVAYKGTQDNVIAAIKGKPYGNSNIEGSNASTQAVPQGQVLQPVTNAGTTFVEA